MPRSGRPQFRLDGGAEDGLGVEPLGQGEGAPAESGPEVIAAALILGCNSIDIFFIPESVPEPVSSHVWRFHLTHVNISILCLSKLSQNLFQGTTRK